MGGTPACAGVTNGLCFPATCWFSGFLLVADFKVPIARVRNSLFPGEHILNPQRGGNEAMSSESPFKGKSILVVDDQKEGCSDHLFIPPLLNMEAIRADSDSVEYENGWINHRNSKEYAP